MYLNQPAISIASPFGQLCDRGKVNMAKPESKRYLSDSGFLPFTHQPSDLGYCYLEKFVNSRCEAENNLGLLPAVEEVLLQPDDGWTSEDDEFGPWESFLPEDNAQVSSRWNCKTTELKLTSDFSTGALHVSKGEGVFPDLLDQLRAFVGLDYRIGVLISDLVAKGADASGVALGFLTSALEKTNTIAEDAADNYWELGNQMEKLNESGGVKEVTRANFVEIVRAVVGRWARPREAVAAANVAASALYSDTEWSPAIFEEAMELDEDEDVKQAKLLKMMGMVLYRDAYSSWNNWVLRRGFRAWRSDLLGPAKAFAKAFGVDPSAIEDITDRAVDSGIPLLKNAALMLRDSALPALQVLATVAAGGAVAAGLIVSAGIIMDWYYADKEQTRLGCVRETVGAVDLLPRLIKRAQEAYSVSAIISDEVYDTTDYTHVVRLDPFFFSIKGEVAQLKDDTAATRLIANAFLTPLINTITSNAKNVLLLPATISNESAQHIQRCLPDFYFKIVNRSHSHPELWAVRRGFELMVARNLVADGQQEPVIMIGANVRQVSKMPRVQANYGPTLSGRDDARKNLKGTPKQRNFFKRKTIPKTFEAKNVDVNYKNGVAVSFFSTQDISKQDFIETCIRGGITRAYVAINIPIIMMDDRITEWEDPVLNARYVRRDDTLSMSVLGLPVAGYDNSFSKTMSWVKPHKPIYGYDVTLEALSVVSSSYLLYVQIGSGLQESHDTLWKMPDAGHYVLPDLTREQDEMKYFVVPEAKFEQVVKFVIQLNGAKNLIESTTGRILGLEAAVRIGGVTLDKAWKMSHREFASVTVHAISCAGIDKADAVFMMGRMREFFSESENRGWFQSALNGYKKLFGWERDLRIPGVASRGRHDYDVVTHWTCRQKSGQGSSASFDEDRSNPGFFEPEEVREDNPGPAGSGDVKQKSSVGKHDKGKTRDAGPGVDSGYVTAEDINKEDANGADASEAEKGQGFVGLFTRWMKPSTNAAEDTKMSVLPDVETSMRICLPSDVTKDHTGSAFNPSGALSFIDRPNQSRSNEAFISTFSSEDDIQQALVAKAEFPAPDGGAARICELAVKESVTSLQLVETTLHAPKAVVGNTYMDELQKVFFKDFNSELRRPSIMLDGLAGAAKSSVVRVFIREQRKSAVIVVPSRKLATDWRSERVGTTVTRHKLTASNISGRDLMVIDEVYAYTKAELATYLSRAALGNMKVILLGDRKQQYEDGAEITVEDINSLGVPIMRFLVSNTMPLDALHILKWAAAGDPFVGLFQTRNPKVHSIHFVGPDHLSCKWLGTREYSNVLVYKDKLETSLGWARSDHELGFKDGKMDDWLSVSRTQGSRTDFSYLLCSSLTKAEKWFNTQRGLFYVATSRHSKGMVMTCFQHDLTEMAGLQFEHWDKVNGRLTNLQDRERMDVPMKVYQARVYKDSPILRMMQSRGMVYQTHDILSLGSIKEDWRPWPKMTTPDKDVTIDIMKNSMLTLVGDKVPYAETDAVKYPVYQAAMGLWSVRRPVFTESDPIKSVFLGMNRLAVNQTSKDEVLDLKNVVERTARPRVIDHDPAYIKAEGERLFAELLHAYFDVDQYRDYTTQPKASDWIAGRTAEFTRKYLSSDPFGLTSASVRSSGFLKTQVKVKVKRNFAMEENYGQTVLASPADYNALLGPWSKVFLRNVRLASRTGVFLDSGYSDAELARGLRDCGAFSRFLEENYQADVKRQDTSHTPVTLRVFKLALVYFGVPEHLAEMYENQSTLYRYRSMHPGLYDGQAENNLGSGDPFTLIRNIFEVMTVMIERFGKDQIKMSTMIIKGDDFISDKIYTKLPVSVQEIRDTQLTEDFNRPPYHAGRFLTLCGMVPDPIRMICKAMVKPAHDTDRVNELAGAFYDRYICLSDRDYLYLKSAIREAYNDFEPMLLDSILDLYCALRDRKVFFDLVQVENMGQKLVVKQVDGGCASYAVSMFTSDDKVIAAVENESMESIKQVCSIANIPVYDMTGRPNDLTRRGVWLSPGHAWAVVNLEEHEDD